MAILRNIFCFSGQAFGLFIFVCGLSQGILLAEHLLDLAQGVPLNAGTLAKRVAACTGPCAVGLAIFFGAGALRRFLAKLARREKEFPDRPWMWRDDWAAQHIRLSNRPAMIVMLVAWCFYLSIIVPVAVWGASIKNPGIVYGFAGVLGLFLLAISRIFWLNRRWNTAELRLAGVPGVVGGPLAGVIVLKETFPADSVFRVALKCERTTHRTSTRSNSSSSSTTDTLWQEQKFLARTLDSGHPEHTALPVYFAIPFGSEPTSVESEVRSRGGRRGTIRSHINWWVEVARRDDPQMRFAKFEVPVFVTPASSPDFIPQEEQIAEFMERPDPLAVLRKNSFHREDTPHGVQLRFSMLRWDVLGGLLIVLAICSAIVAAGFRWASPPVSFFIALIPGVLVVMILVGLFQMLTWGSRVLIGRDDIEIEAGFLGFRRKLTFPRSSPPATRVQQEIQRAAHPMFAIHVTDEAGQALAILRHLDSRQDADAVNEWLRGEWRR